MGYMATAIKAVSQASDAAQGGVAPPANQGMLNKTAGLIADGNAWVSEKKEAIHDDVQSFIGEHFGDDAQEAYGLHRQRGPVKKMPVKDAQEELEKVKPADPAENHMFDGESAFQAMMSARRARMARNGQ